MSKTIVNNIVEMCMNNKSISCNINHLTIEVMYNNGYSTVKFESWHSDSFMSGQSSFGYTPILELEQKIKNICDE